MSALFDSIRQREERSLCQTYARYPIAIASGKGSRLTDVDGREYIDLLTGIAVTPLGQCNDEIANVICTQARTLVHTSNLLYHTPMLDAAEQLLATSHLTKIFFGNSGAEANEGAIKLARRAMRKIRNHDANEIITLESAFHGRTLATLAATGNPRIIDGFTPLPEGFKQVPWGDLNALDAAVTDRTAAVLFEIVQGEAGIRPMPEAYAKGIEAICRRHGILMIVDEVQAGLCRSGRFWAFQHFDLRPDIVTAAKGLANGLAMGAVMTTDELAPAFGPGSHGTTFGAGVMATAVCAKVVEILQRDKLAERAARLGSEMKRRIEAVAGRHPGKIREVRGMGLLIGCELAFNGRDVWKRLIDKGFIANLTHDYTLRLLPALNIPEADLYAFADALDAVLDDA